MTPTVNLPWFMFDLTNKQLITNRVIPSDIRDVKSVILVETPIPGLNYQPVTPGGGGNRTVSFSIQLVQKGLVGNVALLKQFDQLRNRSTLKLWGSSSFQFDSNPKVLYNWGIGSVPLVYWVKKCDAVHKQGWVNYAGAPQYSEIEVELVLDEKNPLYEAEEAFRLVTSALGMVQGAAGVAKSMLGKR